MRIPEDVRVEAVFDYKHGRKFHVFLTNNVLGETFTTHFDSLAREYVKLKLSDSDIMALIQELQKYIAVAAPHPLPDKTHLVLLTNNRGEE